jgi:hypothetical protein
MTGEKVAGLIRYLRSLARRRKLSKINRSKLKKGVWRK